MVSDNDDATSVASVTTIRSTKRNILLVTEINSAIAAITCFDCNLGSIEHYLPTI